MGKVIIILGFGLLVLCYIMSRHPKEDEDFEEEWTDERLITELESLKLITGLCRTEREIIDRAVKRIKGE